MLRTMMLGAAGMVAALAAATPAGAATQITPTGSGTVSFQFLSFTGPVTAVLPNFNGPGQDYEFPEGRVSFNGFTVAPTRTGNTTPTFPGGGNSWIEGQVIFGGGANVSSVGFASGDFAPGDILPTDPRYNRISFTPANFTNVAPGQEFTLGTFEFQNGSWYGGSTDLNFSRNGAMQTFLPFRVTTTSASGSQFNQMQRGVLAIRVNGIPVGADPNDRAVQDAGADYVTVYMEDANGQVDLSGDGVGSFRVYDIGQTPQGFTNVGQVDLRGKFGSLILTGLDNGRGGFITQTSGVLPISGGGGGNPGVIPEPSTWMLMILGFGLIAQQLRRRHLAAA